MKKNVLITGGAGFIGSHLALKLVELGYKVTVLDNLSSQIHGTQAERTSLTYQQIRGKVDFILGTVTSTEDWRKAIWGQDIIFHMAAETGTGQSMYEASKYCDVNIGGTAALMDVLMNTEHCIKQIVLASSRAVYGEGAYFSKTNDVVHPAARNSNDMQMGDFAMRLDGEILTPVATSESAAIRPMSLYAVTKHTQEQIIQLGCSSLGIPYTILRYQNVYGPGQSLKNPYTGILSIFSSQIRRGKGVQIFEDGEESRDFVYVDDVISATVLSIEKKEAENEILNVGTGVQVNVLTVAQLLIEHLGIDVPVEITGKYRVGDVKHNFADISKIQSLLGFQPVTTFSDGVRKLIQWVKNQPIEDNNYERSIVELKEKGLYR